MQTPQTARDIAAPPEVIWAILTDAQALTGPDTGITRIDGAIRSGQTIRLWSVVSPNRAFAIKVGRMDPPHHMEWFSGMPFGLFRGTRSFDVTRTATGSRFEMKEVYTGPLRGLITRAIPDLQPSFDQFAEALRTKAEAA